MSVVAGCDYLPSVRNVGIKKAYELVMRHKTATKTLRVMRMNNQLPLKKANILEEGAGQSGPARRVVGFKGVTSAAVSIDSQPMTTFPSGVEEDRRRNMEAPLPDPGPSVSNLLQYELDFFRALATFRHQVVYDPITRTTVHLEPIDISSLPLCLQYLLPKQREKDSPDCVSGPKLCWRNIRSSYCDGDSRWDATSCNIPTI